MGRAFLHWGSDVEAICRRIEARKSTFKIILKTRNERHFLSRWITHHQNIVPPEDIVIFDNESDDPSVLELLSARDDINVFQYSGFHNHLHRPHLFPDLYNSIRQSTKFYTLIDTDEFFVWIDKDGRQLAGRDIVPALEALHDADLVIGLWADNVLGYEDRFRLFAPASLQLAGLRGGKSVISSRVNVEGMLCHNFQLKNVAPRPGNPAHAILCHMKNLEPEQRIRANIEKLRKYKFLKVNEGLERVLAEDWTQLPAGNVRQWIKEIERARATPPSVPNPSAPLPPGQIILSGSGPVRFHSEVERAAYLAFLAEPDRPFARMLTAEAES